MNSEVENLDSFERFVDLHSVSVFSAVGRLSGLADEKEIEGITVNALVDLWESRTEMSTADRPGPYIFKKLLRHIFMHLHQRGDTGRIAQLRSILLIDPANYLQVSAPTGRTFRPTFVRRMGRIWKSLSGSEGKNLWNKH